jgi:signal transduction histidine kinase
MTSAQNNDNTRDFERLFEQFPDPVVEFKQKSDSEPIILNANAAFIDVFVTDDSVDGRSLNELIVPADRQDEAANFDQQVAEGEIAKAVVERATSNSRRKFLYRGIPINTSRGFAIYSDITEKLKQEQHLDVLQRVLRHNLRNDLNIIDGEVERGLDSVENEQTRDALQSIEETANELKELCSEAQTIRKVINESPKLEPVSLTNVVNSVVEVHSHRSAQPQISVNCSEDLSVKADRRLRKVVDNLVDNAIRHNTSSVPKVAITGKIITDDTVELSIADNGPGISKAEQRVVTDEVQVSQLSHGSGLGLWLVKWLTERYGGSLTIDTPADGGTIIRIRLARADG